MTGCTHKFTHVECVNTVLDAIDFNDFNPKAKEIFLGVVLACNQLKDDPNEVLKALREGTLK